MKNPLNKKTAQPKQPKQKKPNLFTQLTAKKGNQPKENAQKSTTKKTGNGLLDKLRGKKSPTKPSEQMTQTQASSQPNSENQPQANVKKGFVLPSFGKKQPKTKKGHHSAMPTTQNTQKATTKYHKNTLQQLLATKGQFIIFAIIVLIVLLSAFVIASKFIWNNDEQTQPAPMPSIATNEQQPDLDEEVSAVSDENTTQDTDNTDNAEVEADLQPDTATAQIETDAEIDAEADARSEETQSQIANALKGVTPGDAKKRGGNISYDEFVRESKNKIYVEEKSKKREQSE